MPTGVSRKPSSQPIHEEAKLSVLQTIINEHISVVLIFTYILPLHKSRCKQHTYKYIYRYIDTYKHNEERKKKQFSLISIATVLFNAWGVYVCINIMAIGTQNRNDELNKMNLTLIPIENWCAITV